jgi:DNA polymerase elongation subunit (family B)
MEKDKEGKYTNKYKIYKKGVLLTRRDNTKFMKEVYEKVIQDIIESRLKGQSDEVLYQNIISYLISALDRLYSHCLPITQLTITKSIKENNEYKVRPLPEDEKKRRTRLEDLKCNDETDYLIRALPAVVQLAEKMRKRGQYVPAGTRIEYVYLDVGNIKAKQWETVESLQYYKEHSFSFVLNFLHYNKLLINPIDQLLNVIHSGSTFMKDHYEDRENKYKMIQELKELFRGKIKVVN